VATRHRSRGKSVLVNASNLHVGGGVQAACSFISELANIKTTDLMFDVVASTQVDSSLQEGECNTSAFASYCVVDSHGIYPHPPELLSALKSADLVFTIFGPLYQLTKPQLSVVGFAQAWILYPDNEVYAALTLVDRLKVRLKFMLQRLAFAKRSDVLLVEAEHVAQRLSEQGIFPREKVQVIPNSLNSLFLDSRSWRQVDLGPRLPGVFRIGIVCRDYPHKNLAILPDVKQLLSSRYGLEASFYVTLTEAEWARRDVRFRSSIVNVGDITISQCPMFYEQLDAVIFPSLLECFSATPLEAMYMRKPLFASDRPFVRDSCGEYPWYFDPNSPQDAARAIAEYRGSGGNMARLEAAREHVLSLPNAGHRARAYVEAIARLLERN
jgi:glycosyltransferase involved in cell wall biosynthesis